jgi:hypothetical protein
MLFMYSTGAFRLILAAVILSACPVGMFLLFRRADREGVEPREFRELCAIFVGIGAGMMMSPGVIRWLSDAGIGSWPVLAVGCILTTVAGKRRYSGKDRSAPDPRDTSLE